MPDGLDFPSADFPSALADVRDLAVWLVLAAEQRMDGTFNATPTTSMGEVRRIAAEVSGSTARQRRVPVEQLRELGVQGWMSPSSLPLWIDDEERRVLDGARPT